MNLTTFLVAIVVPALLLLGSFAWFRLRHAGGLRAPKGRPWWGSPMLWVGVAAVFLALGLFVAPKLFGFTFLFLPLIWMRLPRRRGSRPPGRNAQ